MGRWFTCVPQRLEGNPAFFWRDSGLLCRALQERGHESRVVLPGPGFAADAPDILRATRAEMESASWWRSLHLDGVIMVAWARHRDTPVVRAIAASGTPLVLHVDGTGLGYPLFNQLEFLKTLWRAERGTGRGVTARSLAFLKEAAKTAAVLLLRYSYLKYRHLRYTTAVTLQTPGSLKGHQRLCTLFGGRRHGVNLRLGGYPIPGDCRWDASIPKEKRIIAIGRWEDLHKKRPNFLMAACAQIAALHPDLHIDIFGTKTEALARWHAALEPDLRERIHVRGVQPGAAVAAALQRAQVSFFPSSGEGGPQALFEGLACGVTTVGFDSPDLPGPRWAAACGHGDLATRDTLEAYVAALDRALRKWERGEYSAREISAFWIPKTTVQSVLQNLLDAAASPAQKRA